MRQKEKSVTLQWITSLELKPAELLTDFSIKTYSLAMTFSWNFLFQKAKIKSVSDDKEISFNTFINTVIKPD